MAEKEYYHGIYKGIEEIRFNRLFRGYKFTDEECERLLAGDELIVRNLVSQSSGKTYHVRARLALLEYEGHPYWGIESEFYNDDPIIPESWCGHTFTDQERALLEKGEYIECLDFYSKKSEKTFKGVVYYDKNEHRIKLDTDFYA